MLVAQALHTVQALPARKKLRDVGLPVSRLVAVIPVIFVVAPVMAALTQFIYDCADHSTPDVLEVPAENPQGLAMGLPQYTYEDHTVRVMAEDQGIGETYGRRSIYDYAVIVFIDCRQELPH